MYKGIAYIRYEKVLRSLHYDNHSEKWTIDLDEVSTVDNETLSVISERPKRIQARTMLNRMNHDKDRNDEGPFTKRKNDQFKSIRN